MEHQSKAEILEKLKKSKEGEYPKFQNAIQNQIDLIESSMQVQSTSSTPAPKASMKGKKRVRRIKDPLEGLRMLAMVSKAESIEEMPNMAGPAIVGGSARPRFRRAIPGIPATPREATVNEKRRAEILQKHQEAMKIQMNDINFFDDESGAGSSGD